jgi:hypothetical protein
MTPSPVETLRETTAFLRAWLDETERTPDFSHSVARSLREIGGRLLTVDAILRNLPPKENRDESQRKAVADYEVVLGMLKARISKLELTLKIRQSQMTRKRASLSAIRGWADLAGHIG